jgi:hypothetical protein
MTSCERFVLVALAAGTLAACSNGAAIPRQPDEYVGCATDENWQTFDETPEVVSAADSPMLTGPMNRTLAADPANFDWQPDPSTVGSPTGDVAMTCAQWNQGFTELHLPPITGCVYDVQISFDGEVQHRVLTTLQQWTASAETWDKLAGHDVTVRIRRMELLENEPEGGPFAPPTPAEYQITR